MDKKKAITSLTAFLPKDQEVLSIIDLCGLEPEGTGWKLWSDNMGHNLIVKNNKTVTSKKANPVTRFPYIIKDIHFKASAKQIAENSKWVMISLAESVEDGVLNICFLWFLGIDGKLRLLCYMKDEWVENKPPLSSGVNTLRTIIKNQDVDRISRVRTILNCAIRRKMKDRGMKFR